MEPSIILGESYSDNRGVLLHNNFFDASEIKRLYTIENKDIAFIRAWQGHRIEQRWFSVMVGSFEIRLIAIDDWDNPSKELKPICFIINAKRMDVLHVPPGYVTSIRALTKKAKLLLMADFRFSELKDEYRFDLEYFIDKSTAEIFTYKERNC